MSLKIQIQSDHGPQNFFPEKNSDPEKFLFPKNFVPEKFVPKYLAQRNVGLNKKIKELYYEQGGKDKKKKYIENRLQLARAISVAVGRR